MLLTNSFVSSVRGRVAKLRANAHLGFREFAVVSNNCWGAHIYQYSGRPYNTPFVGLFLSPTCYLSLLRTWPGALRQKLEFRSHSKEAYVENLRLRMEHPWPVGYLNEKIEIQFLHYSSEEVADATWNRRLARMPDDGSRIFFKFDDRDSATEQQLQEFQSLPLKNKVCFVSEANQGPGRVVVPSESETVPDGLKLSQLSPRYFDAAAWIAGRKPSTDRRFAKV